MSPRTTTAALLNHCLLLPPKRFLMRSAPSRGFKPFSFSVAGLIVVTLLVGQQLPAAEPQARFDLLIRNGRVVDGTGAPWYIADIGIKGEHITAIGRLDSSPANRVIDADGLVVAPGFMDMMGQNASAMLENPKSAMNLLMQGITTINAGEGSSAAPLGGDEALRAGWSTMAEYFQLLDLKGLPVNVAQSVGHSQIRRLVMGDEDRRPSDDELRAMQDHVREAMRAGAIGVSTALIYPPAIYAQTQEIAALAKIAGEFGGRYYTHMRNEGDALIEAIDEAIEIGTTASTPVHIFHLKAAGRDNWGKMDLALARIQAARAKGHQVTADIYPYINNGLSITALVHPRHFASGREAFFRGLDDDKRTEIRNDMETARGWENWYHHVGQDWDKIVVGQASDRRYAEHAGKTIAQIAQLCAEQPWETFFELLRTGAFVLPQSMSEANVIKAIQQPFVSFCTDVGPSSGGGIASHPRAFGALPRLFARYVRDLGVISLEQAVSQASSVAANELHAFDRGRIAIGQAADVIVFDEQNFIDKADFSSPHELAQGMQFVVVNGTLVLDQGDFTGKLPGRVLRGPGYQENQAAHHVMTGRSDAALVAIDAAMQAFIREHRLPGLSLAVSRQGRLVHSRGYGYADVATRQPVEPSHLFRIASVSKPITAVAILQLVEQGKLSLEDRVLEVLEIEPEEHEKQTFDERQRSIMILHLLQHRGGWDRDQSFDAMFQSVRFAQSLGIDPPATAQDVIRAMLSVPLDFDPGERYAYSNYGYCLLGRVIEKLSGQTYEGYVQEHVLVPAGISSMCIGSTRLDQRHAQEVHYYHPGEAKSVFAADLGQPTPSPYGAWYLEAMDSHGGWIASAEDLVRFACALDDAPKTPILTADSLGLIHVRPPGLAARDRDGKEKDVFYGLGWQVREHSDGSRSIWHGGSLPGTNTELAKRHDGVNIALLLNTRVSAKSSSLINDAMRRVHQAIDSVKDWPQHDLFTY